MTNESGETLVASNGITDVLPHEPPSSLNSSSSMNSSPDKYESSPDKQFGFFRSPSSSPSSRWFGSTELVDIYDVYRRREEDESEHEKQDKMMELFVETVEGEGVSMEGVLESTKLRFLVARSFNIGKAAAFYVAHRKWRESFVPPSTGHITEEELPTFKGSDFGGFQYLPGYSPLLILKPKHHSAELRSVEEMAKFSVYGLDKAVGCLPAGEHKFVVIFDLADIVYKNLDTRATIAVLHILQNQYPERLRRVFLIHVPYVFWAAYRIVYPFIDPVTRHKIMFVEDKNLSSTLLADIPQELLPKEYGGDMEFMRTLDVPVVGWPHPGE